MPIFKYNNRKCSLPKHDSCNPSKIQTSFHWLDWKRYEHQVYGPISFWLGRKVKFIVKKDFGLFWEVLVAIGGSKPMKEDQ